MNDAIALLAVSQLVCLGAVAYLYMQLRELRARSRTIRRRPNPGASLYPAAGAPSAAGQAARVAYSGQHVPPQHQRPPAAPVAERLGELGLDVPALARRMQRSEEEVRLLLRRQGVVR
jgi:hypothetical protein